MMQDNKNEQQEIRNRSQPNWILKEKMIALLKIQNVPEWRENGSWYYKKIKDGQNLWSSRD